MIGEPNPTSQSRVFLSPMTLASQPVSAVRRRVFVGGPAIERLDCAASLSLEAFACPRSDRLSSPPIQHHEKTEAKEGEGDRFLHPPKWAAWSTPHCQCRHIHHVYCSAVGYSLTHVGV